MGCCEGRAKINTIATDNPASGEIEIQEWNFKIKEDDFVLRGEKITYHFESCLPIGTYPVRVDGSGIVEIRKNGKTIHKKENGGVILLQSNGLSGIFNALT